MVEKPRVKIPVQTYWDPINKVISHQTIIPNEKNQELAAWSNIMGSYQPEIRVEIMKDEEGRNIGFEPTRGNPTDAGLDIYAAEDVLLNPLWFPRIGEHYDHMWQRNKMFEEYVDSHRSMVKTGIKVEIPPGLCLLLWDRSGLSAKHGVHRVAGVIDDRYRGQLKVALVNLSHKPYEIKRGDRIAQAILTPMILPRLTIVDSLSDSSRGEDGFGSTGR